VDAQDQLRRLHRKIADGGLDRALLVLADTPANRAAVQAAAGLLSTTFAIDDIAAYEALARGRIPPRDALILVRLGGPLPMRGVPRSPVGVGHTDEVADPVGRQLGDAGGRIDGLPAAPRHSQPAVTAVREKP
jgi:hypothetical protein